MAVREAVIARDEAPVRITSSARRGVVPSEARRSRSRSRAYPAWLVLALDGTALSLALHPLWSHDAATAAGYLAMAMALLAMAGHVRPHLALRLANDVSALLLATALPLVVLAGILGNGAAAHDLVTRFPIAVALLVVSRSVGNAIIRAARVRRIVQERTVIVGAGCVGADLAQVLRAHPEYGLVPVGFLDDFDEDSVLPLPLLGKVDSLEDILRSFDVRRVVVAFGGRRDPDIVKVIRAAARMEADVHVVPRFFELGASPHCANTEDVWGIPLVWVRRAALRSLPWRTKRLIDVLVASLGLVVTAPLLALIALAVRLTSPGPILFRQERVGQRGTLIEVLKFRTMYVNSDSDTRWSVGKDGQTRVGPLLRKTSLDELPQLINVLGGDMSLVGPRPERPHFVANFQTDIPNYGDRHRVPVGMTGWAQVHGLRGDTSLQERVRFDNRYIDEWSLSQDLLILARTFSAIAKEALGGRGSAGETVPQAAGPSDDERGARRPLALRLPTMRRRVQLAAGNSHLAAAATGAGPG